MQFKTLFLSLASVAALLISVPGASARTHHQTVHHKAHHRVAHHRVRHHARAPRAASYRADWPSSRLATEGAKTPVWGDAAGAYWQAERARQSLPEVPQRTITQTIARIEGSIWDAVRASADAHGVPRSVAVAIVKMESGGRCDARNRHAVGLMQLMPQTATALGVRNRTDCAQNLAGGMRMLASIGRAHGWGCSALSLYERGEAARPQCTSYARRVLAIAARAG